MDNGGLFNIDFNSIGEGELLEVDVPVKKTPPAEPGDEGVETATAAAKDKNKEKGEEDLIEVEAKGDGITSVAPAKTPQESGEEIDGKDDKSAPTTPSNEEHSPFTPFAKALHEEGILPNLDIEKFGGTADSLFDAVRSEIQVGVDTYKESLPTVVKEIIDNYEEGVPLSELIDAKSKQMEYASIKKEDFTENDALQKAVVRDLLKYKGIKETKVEKIIQSFEDGGQLVKEAEDSLEELQEIHQEYLKEQRTAADARNKEISKRNQEALTSIRSLVDTTTEIIPDLKLNKVAKDRIYNSMTQVVSVDERGNPMNKVMEIRKKDPQKFEMVLHYLADLGVFEGDWSKIKTKAKTSAVKDLEKTISNGTAFAQGNKGVGTSGGSSSLLESLKGFRR